MTEENFCELATKDAEMGNIVIGVYRCFIGDIFHRCFIDDTFTDAFKIGDASFGDIFDA